MMWNHRESTMLVAGHRGVRIGAPENTMTAFRRAIGAGVDMIETDVRMTVDGQLVLMHDATVDRTTDGQGRVCDLTFAQISRLNAANGFAQLPAEAPPTLEAFLALCAKTPGLLINMELKDYPTPGNEAFALESCDRTISLLNRYGYTDKCMLNSFSGKLLEYINEKYGGRYRLHGYYPYAVMEGCRRDPRTYLYCQCVIPVTYDDAGASRPLAENVPPRAYFDAVKSSGIEPGVGAAIRSREELRQCAAYGATLITSDEPESALRLLRELGLHA